LFYRFILNIPLYSSRNRDDSLSSATMSKMTPPKISAHVKQTVVLTAFDEA